MFGYHGHVLIIGFLLERKVTMKMYDKSNLKLVRGMLVDPNGNVITPNLAVIKQANRLEELAQKAKYLADQPDATPMPSLDGFKRKSIMDNVMDNVAFRVSTPHLDFEVERTMRIMEDIDDANVTIAANNMLKEFTELIDFATNDFVVDVVANYSYLFDTPTLGNILELTVDDITETIAAVCGIERFDENDNEDCPFDNGDLDVKVNVFDLTECENCEDTNCFFHPNYESDMVVNNQTVDLKCPKHENDEADED